MKTRYLAVAVFAIVLALLSLSCASVPPMYWAIYLRDAGHVTQTGSRKLVPAR